MKLKEAIRLAYRTQDAALALRVTRFLLEQRAYPYSVAIQFICRVAHCGMGDWDDLVREGEEQAGDLADLRCRR